MTYALFPRDVEVEHFHLFCGIGGGAVGMNRGSARVGNLRATMRCVGGVDSDARAIREFSLRAGCPGTVLDLFTADQYEAWHGTPPPIGWREATLWDLRRAVLTGRTPHIVLTSAPCKGYSGLQSPTRAKTRQYVALNELTVRGFWLLLEAFKDDPVPLIVMENVPRIASSGAGLLDQIDALLECAGYAVAHTVYDAGELGGLGQSRKRFLLVARHREKVRPFLYTPERHPLRTVGEVLSGLPLPGTGPRIHDLPKIEWGTWVRLALILAGKDWRSLRSLDVGDDGMVRGIRIVAERRAVPVSDPRPPARYQPGGSGADFQPYGVVPFDAPSRTVTAEAAPGSGPYSVADPRTGQQFDGTYGVLGWTQAAGAVTGSAAPATGRFSVADPRVLRGFPTTYGVVRWDEEAGVVTSETRPSNGAFSVADPRLDGSPRYNDVFRVVCWDEASGAVTGADGRQRATERRRPAACEVDRPATGVRVGRPLRRRVRLYATRDRPERPPLVVALDGTYHRPFSTLELGALQGYPWEWLWGTGLSGEPDGRCREWIGNLVPPPASQAIGSTMAETILLSMAEQSMSLHGRPVWVMPIAVALAIDPACRA